VVRNNRISARTSFRLVINHPPAGCLWHRRRVDLSSPTLDATRGRLLARFGAQVEPWWERLPGAIADLAARWRFGAGSPRGEYRWCGAMTRRWGRCCWRPFPEEPRSRSGARLLRWTTSRTSSASCIAAAHRWLRTAGRRSRRGLPSSSSTGSSWAAWRGGDAGDAAVDVVDWVFWAVDDPGAWEPRSRDLAVALGLDHERLWAWCAAFAAMLAASRAAQGATAEQVAALLALSP
jgi:hypothetical protein